MTLLNITRLAVVISLQFTFTACSTKTIQKEGYIDVEGGKIWYRIDGKSNKTPLLLLHGGPGSSSYYLESLKELSNDRPVIFIDQLGCGRSSRISDTSLMTVQKNVEQLEQVRKALHLKSFYLYGHSWGTMLGIDYYLKYPGAIKGLIFGSPCFSTTIWTRDADTLISRLPISIQDTIKESVARKDYASTSFKDAVKVYYKQYLMRHPIRQSTQDSLDRFSGVNIYEFMWGPSEFKATGNLLHYNRVSELSKIKVPTLLTAGEFDEARPSTVQYFQSLIKGAEFHVIPNAGHVTMIDNKVDNNKVIRKFLLKMDALN
jgi:proline iminopeptidase